MQPVLFLVSLLTSVYSQELVTVTAPIVDLYCWYTNNRTAADTGANIAKDPFDHTLFCLFEVPFCLESGYGFVHRPIGSKNWQLFYRLDDMGNQMAAEWMNYSDPSTRTNKTGYVFTYTGWDYGNGTLFYATQDEIDNAAQITVVAPLVDYWCWFDNNRIALDTQAAIDWYPFRHTVHCMYDVDFCRESGFGFVYRMSGMDGQFYVSYWLDGVGNHAARMYMESIEPDDRFDQVGLIFWWTGIDDGSGILRSIATTTTPPMTNMTTMTWTTMDYNMTTTMTDYNMSTTEDKNTKDSSAFKPVNYWFIASLFAGFILNL